MREDFHTKAFIFGVDDEAVGKCSTDVAPDLNRSVHGILEYSFATLKTNDAPRGPERFHGRSRASCGSNHRPGILILPQCATRDTEDAKC